MRRLFVIFVLLGLIAPNVYADSRHFTYSYEADSVLGKGKWEFEQWVKFRGVKETGKFYQFDLREEIETGLTDRLTTALYLNLRDVHREGVPGSADLDRLEFKGVSSEWKYMALSPHLHWLGLLLYGEVTYEGEGFELEPKIILQHNFGDNWVLAMNLITEHEWEFEPGDTVTELALEQTLGLSYKFHPNWSIGLEARVHSEFVEYEEYEHSVLFAGPNLHFEKGKGWGTLTVLPQIVDLKKGGRNLDDHEAIEARLIAGILF